MAQFYANAPRSRKSTVIMYRLGGTLLSESTTVEERVLLLLDASPEVTLVERAAPVQVYLPDGTCITYTPDLTVTLQDSQVYSLECKPKAFPFSDSAWAAKATRLEQLGRPLRVVTDADCSATWLEQIRIHRTFYGIPALPAVRERGLTVLRERGAMRLAELRGYLKATVEGDIDPTLNGMLARGELLLDIHAPWETCHVDVPGGRFAPPRAPLGTLFTDLPRGRIEAVHGNTPPPGPASHRVYKASRHGQQYLRLFSLYSDPTLRLDREKAQRLGNEVGVTGRTVYRFRQALFAAGAPGITFDEVLPHLAAVTPYRPRHRVSLDIVAVIEEAAMKRYFVPPTSPGRLGTVAALHETVRRTCLSRELHPPVYNTVNRHLQRMCRRDPVLAERLRYGQERAQQLEIRQGHLDISRYGELISVDCSPADVFVVDEGAGRGAASTRGKGQGQGKGLPYRPTQVVICDVATSQILRIATLPGAARAVDILRLLKEVFLGDTRGLAHLETVPQGSGLPTTVRMDAGTEFNNRAVSGALQHLGIEVLRRHKGVKHHGGTEERIIQDITHAHHALPGTSMHNIQARGEHDAQKKAALSLAELHAFNALWLQRHNSLVRAPSDKTRQAHAQDLIDTGRSVWRPLSDAQRAYVQERFYPSEERKYRRDGLSLFGLTYTHFGTVRGIKVGDHVAVSYDPDDISVVYVNDPVTGQQIPFETRLPHSITAPLPLTVWDVLKGKFAAAKQAAQDGVQTQAQIVDEVLETHRQRVAKEKVDSNKTKAKEKAKTKIASVLPIKRQGRAVYLPVEHDPLEA